jgi:trypsin-like peptidase
MLDIQLLLFWVRIGEWEAPMFSKIALATILVGFAILGCDPASSQTAPSVTSAADLYKMASPSVVLIEIYDLKGEVSRNGSGFLVSAEGAILTNYHVVAHTKQATVRLANKDAYDTVEVLEIDKRKDIALIKIKAFGLPFLKLGRSQDVEVGETVYSLSNPLGVFRNTLSQGIVSGIRPGDGYKYFQISAPISHGSSGGPIFNSKGEVIGIAVATIEEGQNLNFAVPIDYARGMVLSMGSAKSLASIYEPEPEKPVQSATTAGGPPASSVASNVVISDEMKKSSFWYVQSKLHVWTRKEAEAELGEPVRSRNSFDANKNINGEILAYNDPTKLLRELELNFDAKTQKLAAIYGSPWDFTWAQCKTLWGNNVRTTKNPDGTRFHSYKDRNLTVLVNKDDKVISFGSW